METTSSAPSHATDEQPSTSNDTRAVQPPASSDDQQPSTSGYRSNVPRKSSSHEDPDKIEVCTSSDKGKSDAKEESSSSSSSSSVSIGDYTSTAMPRCPLERYSNLPWVYFWSIFGTALFSGNIFDAALTEMLKEANVFGKDCKDVPKLLDGRFHKPYHYRMRDISAGIAFEQDIPKGVLHQFSCNANEEYAIFILDIFTSVYGLASVPLNIMAHCLGVRGSALLSSSIMFVCYMFMAAITPATARWVLIVIALLSCWGGNMFRLTTLQMIFYAPKHQTMLLGLYGAAYSMSAVLFRWSHYIGLTLRTLALSLTCLTIVMFFFSYAMKIRPLENEENNSDEDEDIEEYSYWALFKQSCTWSVLFLSMWFSFLKYITVIYTGASGWTFKNTGALTAFMCFAGAMTLSAGIYVDRCRKNKKAEKSTERKSFLIRITARFMIFLNVIALVLGFLIIFQDSIDHDIFLWVSTFFSAVVNVSLGAVCSFILQIKYDPVRFSYSVSVFSAMVAILFPPLYVVLNAVEQIQGTFRDVHIGVTMMAFLALAYPIHFFFKKVTEFIEVRDEESFRSE